MNTKHLVQKVFANEKQRLKELNLKIKYSPTHPTKFLNAVGKKCDYNCVVTYDINKTGNNSGYVTETYEVYEHLTKNDKLLVKQQLEDYNYDLPIKPDTKTLFCDVMQNFSKDDKILVKQELVNCDCLLSISEYKTITFYDVYGRLTEESKSVIIALLEKYDYNLPLDHTDAVSFYDKQKFEFVLIQKPQNFTETIPVQKSQFLHKRLNKHYTFADNEYSFEKDCYFVVDAKLKK